MISRVGAGIVSWALRISCIVLVAALAAEFLLMFGNVVLRATTRSSVIWGEEAAWLCLEVLAFLGAAVAFQRRQHMSLRVIVDLVPEPYRLGLESASDWIVLLTSVAVFILALPLYQTMGLAHTPALGLPNSLFLLPMSSGMLLLVLFAASMLLRRRPRKIVAAAGLAVMATAGLVVGAVNTGIDLSAAIPLFCIFVFGALLVIGVPIGFVLTMVTITFLVTSGVTDPASVPLTMEGGLSNFILLALPFFIAAGFVMIEGGLSKPLARFVEALVGRFPGGLYQVTVVTMFIFSGISGSKLADVAAVGTTLQPALKENGYNPSESVAVLSASAVMGETIPPSIVLLILASITTLSIGGLFLAGILPAAVMAIFLMAAVYVRARREGQAKQWVPLESLGRAGIRAVPALAIPGILIGGILGGIATPTEVSSFAVAYAVLVAAVFYRGLSPLALWRIFDQTAVMAGMILFIYTAAIALSRSLTAAGLADTLVSVLPNIANSSVMFLLGSLILLIVTGAVLEGVPALIVLAPLLFPLAPRYGIDPLQYGIVLIFAMGLGSFIPPLGVGVYVAAAIFRVPIEPVIPRLMVYLLVLFVGLLVVTFLPWFTLVVPHAFHVRS